MRVVIAQCSVDYAGRLSAHLPMATRALMVKGDGTVLIHSDTSHRPLNWMASPCTLVTKVDDSGIGQWVVTNKGGETLTITIEDVLHDSAHDLGIEPGLIKDGVEAQLQVLLAANVETLGEGWRLVRREYPTAIGPVDLLCRDDAGGTVAVEIKRRGEIRAILSTVVVSDVQCVATLKRGHADKSRSRVDTDVRGCSR